MLVRLSPREVTEDWDLYGTMIEESLAPHIQINDLYMTRVLESVMMEDLVCWAVYSKDEKLIGLMTTTVYVEPITDANYLLIFSLFGVGEFTKELVADGIIKLKDFAKQRLCVSIIGYSNVKSILDLVKASGGSVSFSLINWSTL